MSAGTRTIVNRQGSSETTNDASLTSANNERMMNAPLAHQAKDRNRVPSSRTCLGDFEESVADFVSISDCELSVGVAGFGVFGVFRGLESGGERGGPPAKRAPRVAGWGPRHGAGRYFISKSASTMLSPSFLPLEASSWGGGGGGAPAPPGAAPPAWP